MEHKMEKGTMEEKIVEVESAPGDAQVKESKKPLHRRRRVQLCCCVVAAAVVVMMVVILILVLAVFKAKDPDVWVNDVKLADMNMTYGTTLVPRIRLRLRLNITVHNPNKAGFSFTNGTSQLFYDTVEVGHAVIPAGHLGAGHTVTQVVMLNVQADKFLTGSNFTKDFAAGLLPVSATTKVSGRVNVLNVYKRHAVSNSWCNVLVFIANATMASFHCKYTLHH